MGKLITISPYLQGALQGVLDPSTSPGLKGVDSSIGFTHCNRAR
jgi:hypothetical protein